MRLATLLCLAIALLCLGCDEGEDDGNDADGANAGASTDNEQFIDAALSTGAFDARATIRNLRTAMQDSDEDVRFKALRTIRRLGPEAAQLIPYLRGELRRRHWLLRAEAVTALAAIGPQTLADLQTALQDDDPRVRAAAAMSLGQLGPQAAPAIPSLRQTLRDRNGRVRCVVADALGKIGTQTIPDLQMALGDRDWRVHSAAARALRQMGPEAAAAIPTLSQGLRHDDWEVRAATAYALGRMGPQAVPDLLLAARDQHWGVRSALRATLQEISDETRSALTDALAEQDDDVRAAVTGALRTIRRPP